MEEGKILHHLLQEVQDITIVDEHPRDCNNEQVHSMIEKYCSHVMKQQNKLSTEGNKPNYGLPQARKSMNYPVNNPLMSHSQPCLFSVTEHRNDQSNTVKNNTLHYQHSSDPREENIVPVTTNDSNNGAILLQNEIGFLKQQVDMLQKKTEKLNQLEIAYGKIEQEFEQVLLQREKHEKLEKAVILKMEQQIQRLTQENEYLQKEKELLNPIVSESKGQKIDDVSRLKDQQHQQQLNELNSLLNDLIAKNKELMTVEERQRIELEAQTTTLEEQRTHIEMLEKALSNAQERLLAKDRQAIDAVAVMDKCAHLQKLLQEALDEKQKCLDEQSKQKTQFEVEIAQLRLLISEDASSFGSKKIMKSSENEELVKLKKTLYNKDERIAQLESRILSIQKRYNDDLSVKVEALESENFEKERRIQKLLEEKQRIHNQWAEERRSLDHRVRMLEQDLRILIIRNNGAISSENGVGVFPNANYSIGNSIDNGNQNILNCQQSNRLHLLYTNKSGHNTRGLDTDYKGIMNNSVIDINDSVNANISGIDTGIMVRQRSSTDLPTNSLASVDSTYARMEDLRRKIADRRASVTSSSSSGSVTGKNVCDDTDANSTIADSSKIDGTTVRHQQLIACNMPELPRYSPQKLNFAAQKSQDKSPRSSFNYQANFMCYREPMLPSTRRRLVASERVILRNLPVIKNVANVDVTVSNSNKNDSQMTSISTNDVNESYSANYNNTTDRNIKNIRNELTIKNVPEYDKNDLSKFPPLSPTSRIFSDEMNVDFNLKNRENNDAKSSCISIVKNSENIRNTTYVVDINSEKAAPAISQEPGKTVLCNQESETNDNVMDQMTVSDINVFSEKSLIELNGKSSNNLRRNSLLSFTPKS